MEAPNGQDTDPSDFTDTLVPGLQDLDNVIRCGICKNYMKDAMVTSCSHTYCAKCIRAAITANGKCPLCSKTIQTSTLRFNWPIREVVGHWSKARADVLSLVSQRDNSKIPDLHDPQLIQDAAILRKRGIAEVENATESPRYKTRSRRDPEATSSATPASRENNVSIDHADDEKDGDYSEEEASNITPAQAAQAAKAIMVSCPICSERMLESAVFSHLDHCMGPERATQIANAKSQSKSSFGTFQQSVGLTQSAPMPGPSRSPNIPQQPVKEPETYLAFWSYDMMKDQMLRKKLQELGIVATGSKELMKQRHMYWVNLWNANADSDNPRSKRELLREMDSWERTLGGRSQAQPNTVMAKDFDRDGYIAQNSSHFKDLVAQARETARARSQACPSTTFGALSFGSANPSSHTNLAARPHVSPSAPIPAQAMFLEAAQQLNDAAAKKRNGE